ncbi:MAG: hypothetical protein E7256_02800 [Lachnospiraceae bacterium]|nr:hypothetical protein [Lachnospiraceae bacterium]
MLLSILLAIIFAKLQHYKIKPLFRNVWLLPLAVTELVYIVFQISLISGYYGFIRYAQPLKTISLYVLILPILRYRLYKPSIVGSALILIGTYLNRLVMSLNNGLMPVFPTLSSKVGYFTTTPLGIYDTIHCLGDVHTRLKILTDYIDLGYCILSPGDLFVHSFTVIILYYTIKQLNNNTLN